MPTHPGFGKSGGFDQIDTIEDMAFHYVELFDALGLDEVILGGVSLGGWIAAEFAVRWPERVKKLWICDAPGLWVDDEPLPRPVPRHARPRRSCGELLFHDPDGHMATPGHPGPTPTTSKLLAAYQSMTVLARLVWERPYDPKLAGAAAPRPAARRCCCGANTTSWCRRPTARRITSTLPHAQMQLIAGLRPPADVREGAGVRRDCRELLQGVRRLSEGRGRGVRGFLSLICTGSAEQGGAGNSRAFPDDSSSAIIAPSDGKAGRGRTRSGDMTVPPSPDGIEPDRAVAIFAEFAAADDLALRFPADGCYARTHVMVRRLLDQGLTPSKVWAFAAGVTDLLWTETPDHPDGRVEWGYHVAPVLMVRGEDGGSREMAFDPVLFDRPVPVEEWRNALHDTPTLVRTAPGEPPFPERGGSGYWPGPDPLEGPEVHARETLEEYGLWNA